MNPMTAIELAGIILSGIAAGVCFWPGNYGWMFWFVFAPFFWITQKREWKGAFLYGWLFGAAAWAAGIYWLVTPLSKFMGISLAPALVLFSAICAYHGLMFAVFGGVCRAGSAYFSRRLGWTRRTALFWTAMPAMAAIEDFFPKLFPVHFANTQYFHLPAVQSLELTGPAGMVWLTVGFNASLYLLAKALWERSRFRAGSIRFPSSVFAAVCVLVLINECYGIARMRQIDADVKNRLERGHSLKASIIQGSVDVKTALGEVDGAGLEVYRNLTAEAVRKTAPDLIIWPESVYGRTVQYEIRKTSSGENAVFGADFKKIFTQDFPEKINIIMGSTGEVLNSGGKVRFNIAYAAGPDKRLLGLIQKRRLFPFGEFIPLGEYFPELYRLIPGAVRLSPGKEPDPIDVNGAKAGVVICYEDLDTSAALIFSRKGADVLVNITNEMRFGYEMIPLQHLMFSALRAIENRKFFLRAVNTGISAVIDPCGRISGSIGVKERSFMTEEIALMDSRTFYSRHGRFFNLSGVLTLSILILSSFIKQILRRNGA